MKVKNILSTISLSIVLGLGVFAGIALNKGEVKEAKAEGDDTMFTVVIDLADAVGYTDFHRPEVHYYDSVSGTIDAYQDLHLLNGTRYTTTLSFDSSTQTIDNIMFLFKQTGDEDKWSNSISFTPSANYVYHFNFKNTWTGANWDVEQDAWNGLPRVRGDDIGDTNFTSNVANKTYKVTVSLNPTKTYQVFFGNWGSGAFRQSSINNYLTEYSLNSFEVKAAGTYDIICFNEYSDGGIFEIIKHESTEKDIFLVGIEPNAYIYTFGRNGAGEFGAFPGKKLSEVINMYSRADIDLSDIKFEGADVNILMLVNVEMGYPDADHIIISYLNEFGVVGNQTADMLLSPGSAYWFSNDNNYHNDDAGAALEFLRQAKGYLDNPGVDGSVCNLSSNNAKEIVNMYNALTDDVRYYVDRTTYNTYKRDGSSGKEDVNFRIVMEQISEIANIALVGSNGLNTLPKVNNSIISLIVVISAITTVSVIAFVIIKKKRLEK